MTHEEIVNLGKLVNINITESESVDLSQSMKSILGYIDQIQNVDTSNIEISHINQNPELREDVAIDAGFTDGFLLNVPNKSDGYVKVPKVLNTD